MVQYKQLEGELLIKVMIVLNLVRCCARCVSPHVGAGCKTKATVEKIARNEWQRKQVSTCKIDLTGMIVHLFARSSLIRHLMTV